MLRRKCFVIMPFGEKKDPSGAVIDFDDLYEFMIRGAIEDDLKLECIRCDRITEPGTIHHDMIREIFEAEVAVVDITTTNANVFYELGVRHALRKGVTVVIRRKGTDIPFNIRDLRIVEYDPSKLMTLVQARKTIAQFIEAGLRSDKNDSIVHEYLDLRVITPPKPIADTQVFLFGVTGAPGKAIGLITGDLQKVTIADIWVNSENTNMQMARFYDGSISGVIRFLGAKRNDRDEVVDDIVARDLRKAMDDDDTKTVAPATVIPTSSGELRNSHGVKRIFHVAAVQGAVGGGYSPVPRIEECVRKALERADRSEPENETCSSILFPLLGAGTADGDLEESYQRLLHTAVAFLKTHPHTRIDRVYFLAWTEAERQSCLSVMERLADDLRPLTADAGRPLALH